MNRLPHDWQSFKLARVQLTSPLTFKVAGVAKNVGTMLIGIGMGESLNAIQTTGYVIASAATVYYSMLRRRPGQSTSNAQKAA